MKNIIFAIIIIKQNLHSHFHFLRKRKLKFVCQFPKKKITYNDIITIHILLSIYCYSIFNFPFLLTPSITVLIINWFSTLSYISYMGRCLCEG